MPSIKPENSFTERDFASTLARGLEVITAFGRESQSLTLADVARRTGFSRAAARRLVLTLQELGYIHAEGRQYALTPKILELGYAYLGSLELPELSLPFMEEVVQRCGESCSISVLSSSEIVYIARRPTSRIMSVNLNIGTKLPAFWTSMGRVLLSALSQAEVERLFHSIKAEKFTERTVTDEQALYGIIDRVRADNYSIVDQELEIGLQAIAVPLRNRRGIMVAALNISAHTSRITLPEMQERFLPALQEASMKIQRALP